MLAVAQTPYCYIELDDKNVAFIAGTNMKLVELISSYLAYGWSPEELHFNYPHLSMGQIHSALAYYFDHQIDIDKEINMRLEKISEYQQQLKTVDSRKFILKLEAQKKC